MNRYLKKILSSPLNVILEKILLKIKNETQKAKIRRLDKTMPTYTEKIISGTLQSYLPKHNSEILIPQQEKIIALSKLYKDHYFDLLGSGWVHVRYGMRCRGLEGHRYEIKTMNIYADKAGKWLEERINHSNIKESQKIWELVDESYEPIDWCLDFKSGFRWSESDWYKDIKYGHRPGADIKVPWELARMQHLPMFAWDYAMTKDDGYYREFRNQLLDFIATNPPRYGVNWHCTMDVAIRVVNWLVSYDLLCAFGACFDKEFEEVFKKSVYEHGKHCFDNLEYSPWLRSNHYLADLAGLLFCGAYLPSTKESDSWLVFSVQELLSEINTQFNLDGSNFEASTNYHRLSTEIYLFCTALCLKLPDEKKEILRDKSNLINTKKPLIKHPRKQLFTLDGQYFFPLWYLEKLERAVEFTTNITKTNGDAPQIGDNDSGRFLKLWPEYIKKTVADAINMYKNLEGYKDLPPEAEYWDESILDHRHLIGVGGVMFRRKDLLAAAGYLNPEISLMQSWLQNVKIPSYHHNKNCPAPSAAAIIISITRTLDEWREYLERNFGKPLVSEFKPIQEGQPLTSKLKTFAYPDFGLFLFRSPRLYLAIRCGSIGQNGNGGHAHNDQLSIELNFDGKDYICDPGTYLYTPLPARRNQFRSTAAHFTLQFKDKEQNHWIPGIKGLFCIENQAKEECLYFMSNGFVGKHKGFGHSVWRVISINDQSVSIYDFGEGHLPGDIDFYSNGYGKWVKEKS